MTIACICAVGYQIFERISFFRSWPVNVNVEVNYNKTLTFPTVTICNQNSFRATKAAELGLYDLIQNVFSKSAIAPLEDIKRYNSSNITMEDLFIDLGHDKYDLVVGCRWKNTKCSPADFVPVLTDHGLCYTFSPNSRKMAVSVPGIDSGLQLMLNIEQYEYMNGPHDSAGVKVLLHDPRQTPLVASLGQSVSTGFSTFAGINLRIIEYQSPPYGDCGSKQLNHTDFYTAEECFLDCMTTTVTQKCGCRDIHMGKNDHAAIGSCNLEQYFRCMKDAKDDFFEKFEYQCECPVSCKVTMYDSVFSEGYLSEHAVDSLLSSNQTKSLYTKLLKASETKARMDKRKQEEFRSLFEPLKEIYEQFRKSSKTLLGILWNNSELLHEVMVEYVSIHRFLDWKREWQLYAFYMGVLQDRDKMSNYLSESGKVFLDIWVQRLQRLLNTSAIPDTLASSREHMYQQTIDELCTRKQFIRKAQADVTSLFHSFSKGVIDNDILYIDKIHYYINRFAPILEMKEAYFNYSILSYYPMPDRIMYCKEELNNIYSNISAAIDQFIELTETAFRNPGNGTVYRMYVDVIPNYVNATLESNSCRGILNRMMFRYPINKIELNKINALRYYDDVRMGVDGAFKILHELIETVASLLPVLNIEFKQFIDITNEYLDFNHYSMTNIYSEYIVKNIRFAIVQLKLFSHELDINVPAFKLQISKTIWELNQEEVFEGDFDDEEIDTYEYLYYNYSRRIKNFNFLERQLLDAYEINISTLIGDKDQDFIDAVEAFVQYFDTFNRSVIIDSNFLKKNFLKLNIFYRQLSYEHIKQQKGYDVFALICDIGGSMGLFIGASMLTVVEVIDLLLGQTVLFRKKTQPKGKQSSKSIETSRF